VIPSAGAARRRAAGWAAVALLAAAGACAATAEDVAAHRARTAERAADRVRDELVHALGRARAALDDLGAALEGREADDPQAFDRVEAVRARHAVDGLAWEGPGGETVWAGRTLEPLALPAPPPWDASFRAADVTWHEGPFVRALVVGPRAARGGFAHATVFVEERRPTSTLRPFERRWLRPLGVESDRVVPPEAPFERADGTARSVAEHPEGEAAFAVVADAPGFEAVRDRLRERRAQRWGVVLLVALAAAVVVAVRAGRRALRTPGRRALAASALVVLVRAALDGIDLPGRFPFLRPAFQSSDFGIDTWLGWLASPADFALTALMAALVAGFLARGSQWLPSPRPTPLRALAFLAGLATAALAGVAWVHVMDLAAQAQVPLFAASSFVPPLPAALLLGGLVVASAAAWLAARAGLRGAWRTSPFRARGPLFGAALAAVAAAAAYVFAGEGPTRWAAPLVPAVAALFLRPQGGPVPEPAPARILLLAVLATALLFPPLWAQVGERRTIDLETTLDRLLRREATAALSARTDLDAASRDPWLRAALARAAEGTRPEGLALHVWLGSFLSAPGEHGIVTVLDAREAIVDQFSLLPLPTVRLPRPAFPAEGAGDLEVIRARGERDVVRSVVGRLRLRTEEGAVLGGVVFTVPDALDLELAGLGALLPGVARAAATDRGRFPLQFAVLEGGAVVASSDPGVSHEPGGFGPPEVARLGPAVPEASWRHEDEEGHAVWSNERGGVIAVRRRTADAGDVLLSLARLVVVGVGLGAVAALVALLLALRAYRPRLHQKILLSYFAISVVPLALLGWATAAEARSRYESGLAQRLQRDLARVRSDLESFGPLLFDTADDTNLTRWAHQRGHDILLYRGGLVAASSRPGLVEAELLGARLPPEAHRAAVLERRETVRREASFAGREVWFGYAPVLDARDRAVAVIGVPLLYDKDRIEEDLAVRGSALLAAYLLTVVLVVVGGIYAAGRIARPIDLLAAGTKRVAEGELDVALPGEGRDELGQLVAAFNQMTRDLRRAAEQTARVEREGAWRSMARQVAHEIKNPLTPIRLMIQQMQADAERDPARANAAIQRTAAVVLRQIEALGRIAGDFAQFARPPRRAPRDVDVAALVAEVAQLYSGSAAEGIDVVADAPPDLPRVRWDEEELRRVLVNLVGNAVQSIRGRGRVDVRARPEERRGRAGVRVEVADTGVGIARENLERLFEPGFSTKTSGTGLGLAIVRGILDDMGGDVEVESRTGHGSTFRVWWPCTPDVP
jgi:signal transduction histidine kinase